MIEGMSRYKTVKFILNYKNKCQYQININTIFSLQKQKKEKCFRQVSISSSSESHFV